MAERAYDPELIEWIPLLPTVSDFGDPADLPRIRANMVDFIPAIDPRSDVVREDLTVPGREGDPDVSVRVYRPAEAPGSPMPGLLEIHGGGFILGNVDMMDGFCDLIAADFPAVVVSVEYRLAPEDPFPAGLEDCYAALVWFADNAAELGVDPDRIAVGGQSAGGGLAAATALLARDRGGPLLRFQLLEIPELDDRLETASMVQFDDTPLWNRPNAVHSWKLYLGDDGPEPGADDVSPYAAPSRAEDLSGLPPAYVSVMEFDPLRDEGIRYAARLLESGVSTELHAFPGTFHGSAFLSEAGVSKRCAKESFDALARALR
ncbi:MAG: alpha/beta hydrolase [Acidobacteria bacterium]|nr:alpha/beta hydrolase [Acidobacteriota bacterium]